MENTQIENNTEKTNTTFDYNTTNTIDLHADTDSTSSITATTTRTSTTEEQPLFVKRHYHLDTSTYYRPTFKLNPLLNKITIPLPSPPPVQSPYLGKTTTTHFNQSNAATTTNIPTTTTTHIGPLVNPIFTPLSAVVVFSRRLLCSPRQSCCRCQATTAPQAQLIDCCFKPFPPPRPTTRTRRRPPGPCRGNAPSPQHRT